MNKAKKPKLVLTDEYTRDFVIKLARDAGRGAAFDNLPHPAPGDRYIDASTGVEFIYARKTVESNLTREGWEVFTG